MHGRTISLRVESRDTAADALKRIALELLDDALRRLRSRSAKRRARNVHETRKRLKELRAILRLVDSSAGAKWLSRLFRDIGRELSPAREADSALETFRKLRLRRKLDPEEFQRIDACLTGEITAVDSRPMRALVAAAREQIARWPSDSLPLRRFERRLQRTYRSARRRMARSIRTRNATDLHEWRKRAKEHWYQTLILAAVMPELQAREARLHALSRALGKHHDLMLLRDAIARHADDLGDATSARVIEIATGRSAELEQKVIALGAALFSEPPRLWMQHTEDHWSSATEPPILTT